MGIPQMIPHSNDKTAVKSWFTLTMCFVYMIQFLSDSYVLTLFLCGLAIFVFCSSLSGAKPIPRLFGSTMFVTGVMLNLWKGTTMEGMVNGIVTNLPLLTLVILVPLLSIPLKIGGYLDSIHFYMERMGTDLRKTFGSISVILFCLGPILNLGSIRVLHEMIQDLHFNSKFLAKVYLVGFSTVILWSPYFASVAMVLYYLNVPVFDYLPLGFSLAVIQLLVGNLLFRFSIPPQKGSAADEQSKLLEQPIEEEWEHKRKMGKLFGIIVLLMGSIFLMEYLTHWPMLFLVSFTSILFPVLWCAVYQKWGKFRLYFSDFKNHSVPFMSNEIVLFISAGLFGSALAGTQFASSTQMFLHQVASVSFVLFIVTVMFIMMITAFIGIHQIVTVTVLITQIDPSVVGTSPEVLALLFMSAWSLSAVLSPVNPLNLLVSSYVKAPTLSIGLKWNGWYLLTMFFISSLFIYFVR
jgi:hypothetical protein